MYESLKLGRTIALDVLTRTKLVLRIDYETAQGCGGLASVGDVDDEGFTCVLMWRPSDCMSGREVWERPLTLQDCQELIHLMV